MHSTIPDLLMATAGSLFVLYSAMLLAALWLIPSLRKVGLIESQLCVAHRGNRSFATIRALTWLFFGAYVISSATDQYLLSYIAFAPFAIFAVIMIRMSVKRGGGQGTA